MNLNQLVADMLNESLKTKKGVFYMPKTLDLNKVIVFERKNRLDEMNRICPVCGRDDSLEIQTCFSTDTYKVYKCKVCKQKFGVGLGIGVDLYPDEPIKE